MKRVLAAILAFNLVAVAWPAFAQPGGRRFERPEQSRPGPSDAQRRQPREAMWPTRDGQEQSGHGRMSPEERRQLRRDINSHGRDIYRENQERK